MTCICSTTTESPSSQIWPSEVVVGSEVAAWGAAGEALTGRVSTAAETAMISVRAAITAATAEERAEAAEVISY